MSKPAPEGTTEQVTCSVPPSPSWLPSTTVMGLEALPVACPIENSSVAQQHTPPSPLPPANPSVDETNTSETKVPLEDTTPDVPPPLEDATPDVPPPPGPPSAP